jgi:hypothetical protein
MAAQRTPRGSTSDPADVITGRLKARIDDVRSPENRIRLRK